MVGTTSEVSNIENIDKSPRVAMLLQGAGAYWQPILSELSRRLPQTVVFTPCWDDFLPGFEDSFVVKTVGTIKVLTATDTKGYSPSITYLSPRIIGHLYKFKPDVIFSTAFSLWTVIAVSLKPLFNWRVVIVYDGSSPGVDYEGSGLRSLQRRLMAKWVDAFITNNQAGKSYLTASVKASEDQVFARPYLVPDLKTYVSNLDIAQPVTAQLQRPIFVFVGKLIPRKGLYELLQACALLKTQGYQNYTLLVVGDGEQRQELAAFVDNHHLTDQVTWVGEVKYEHVGSYFQQSDVFIFPTLEDVWGLVAVEAMMFGKPILCSQGAGASEMLVHGQNGYVFDPQNSEELAGFMKQFLDHPDLIQKMGEQSKLIMADHTPEKVSEFLAEVVEVVLK